MLTRTTNGALTFNTTESKTLDLFHRLPTLREKPPEGISLLVEAIKESPQDAMRTLFYTRDIRGGQGERRIFRECYKFLCTEYPDLARQITPFIPEYGRWDDLFSAFDTPLESLMVEFIKTQLEADLNSKHPSLLAKWLPREKSAESAFAIKFASAFGLSMKWYRKQIADLSRTLQVLEQKLCANEWAGLQYERIPSQAMKLYRKAFAKHDPTGFALYMEKVEKGEKKINAGTLTPNQLVPLAFSDDRTVEALWKALPNFMGDQPSKILPLIDVSGSMGVPNVADSPMAISLGLGLYVSERSVGAFHNKFITFHTQPQLLDVPEGSLYHKLAYIMSTPWGGSTSLQAAMKLIVDGLGKLPAEARQESCPEALLIISDMQFDQSTGKTDYVQIREQFKALEVPMPNIVFWNVAGMDSAPVLSNDKQACLVSGKSPSIMQFIMSGLKDFSPLKLMRKVLDSDRYSKIVIG